MILISIFLPDQFQNLFKRNYELKLSFYQTKALFFSYHYLWKIQYITLALMM